MSDFVLDLRTAEVRRTAAGRTRRALQLCEASRVQSWERAAFTLTLARVDREDLWGPCQLEEPAAGLFVALAGRVAFDAHEWEAADRAPGTGGLACRIILEKYRRGGADALTTLNGNFAVLVHDEAAGTLHLVTDRCGMTIAYGNHPLGEARVVGTHPDAVAAALGTETDWDAASLAEFLVSGRLTHPFTYHRAVRAFEPGTLTTWPIGPAGGGTPSARKFFEFRFQLDHTRDEWQLGEQLAGAFRNAVRRRTLPRLGRVAVGLSGGLDSRAILSAALPASHLVGITLFDEVNPEVDSAKSVAEACGIPWIPVQRDFEYYGRTAAEGVRISGGVGCFASNHFLGLRQRLADEGVDSLLTGCYCDYLFKGLSLNTTEKSLSRSEEIVPFRREFYRPVYDLPVPQRAEVDRRYASLFPETEGSLPGPEQWSDIQRRRSLPLAYEGDLAQRVIPQRVIPWYLPIVDNDLMDLFQRIPPAAKLNASVFSKMLVFLCDKKVQLVPDSNTGATPNGSRLSYAFHRFSSALQNRLARRRSSMATRGSWPNWEFYLPKSTHLKTLWEDRRPDTADALASVLGSNPWARPWRQSRGRDVELFLRLLTLKLWFDQRTSS